LRLSAGQSLISVDRPLTGERNWHPANNTAMFRWCRNAMISRKRLSLCCLLVLLLVFLLGWPEYANCREIAPLQQRFREIELGQRRSGVSSAIANAAR
jgi:hypothetical protein